jgi:hypothetical protein
MRREANVGGILGELFSLLGDAGRDFAIFTLVVGGVTAAGVLAGLTETTAGALNYDFGVDSSDTPASALFELASAVVSILGTYLLLARFLAVRGRLHTGGGRFWHYLGMAIISTIAVVFGLLLLIVPGVIMLVRWSAASGFVIGAGEGVDGSLGASWEATKGRGWSIFLAAVILFVGILVCAGVAGGIAGAVGADLGNAVAAFVEAAASGVFAAFGIAVYCLVTDDAKEISEVFA